MAIQVFSEALERRFIAKWYSFACLINLIVILGALIFPVYIIHASGGIWEKQAVRYEQLQLVYKNRLSVEVSGYSISDDGVQMPFTTFFTTAVRANELLGSMLRPMIFRSSSLDHNQDGISDEITISVEVPIASNEVITSATAVAFMDVAIQDNTRMIMDSLLIAQSTFDSTASVVRLDGDVCISQRNPIANPRKGIFSPYYDSPLPDLDSASSLSAVLPSSLVSIARSRNFSLDFSVPYTSVEHSSFIPGSEVIESYSTVSRRFQFDVVARAPLCPVVIRPSLTEELKWGWIQYVPFLFITLIVAYIIRYVLFAYRVVDTSVLLDAPASGIKLHAA